jgi:hypothetical protein
MSVSLSPVGGAAGQFFDSNGNPLAGGKLYSYAAGTTTPETTYTSVSGLTANPNPIILNSGGRVPSEIWLTDGVVYKFGLYTSTDQLIGIWDDISGINDVDAANIPFVGFKGQVGFVEDLADNDGADWIGFQPAGSGIARSAQDKMRDTISVKDFGAIGDGTADDTAAVQSAITAASASSAGQTVYFPTGKYKLTAPINISASVTILGDEPSAIKIGGGIGGGTWLFFSHTGKGLNITNSAGYFAGVQISQIGTYRTQPAPTPGWSPTAHDFDIFISGLTDINIFNVTLLNPTNGIKQTNGGGRINIDYLKMQAMTKGIVIDDAYDVCRISNVQMWPFWEDDADVHTWMLANLDGISMGRCDNPMLTNIFTIFANSGIRFYQTAAGATSKVHLVNADFDAGINGIRIDNTVTNGVTGQFSNVTHQGFTGSNNSVGVIVAGTSSILTFTSLKTAFCGSNGVRVDGTANRLSFSDLSVLYYDQAGTSFPAVEVAVNNFVQIALQPFIITAAPGVGPKYGGAGRISVDDWLGFSPVFVSSTGTITTFGTSDGRYKIVGNTVFVKCYLGITTNGTGAGSLRMNLPSALPIFPTTGCGKEIAVTGQSVSVQVSQAVADVGIVYFNNTYPGANGSIIDLDFSYIIAQV